MVDRCSASGWIDGRTGRLPTVLVRPGTGNMAATVCYSGLVREVLQVRAAGGGWRERGHKRSTRRRQQRQEGEGSVLPLTGLLGHWFWCVCGCQGNSFTIPVEPSHPHPVCSVETITKGMLVLAEAASDAIGHDR